MVDQTPKHSVKRMRTIMIILMWLLAFVLLLYFFNGVLTRQQNPNRQPVSTVSKAGVREVILKANDRHSFYVSGFINQHPVTFLLDTGATNVAIPATLNNTLGLPLGQSMIVDTANGRSRAYATTITRLSIGNIVLTDIHASINPTFKAKYILLGMNALKQLEFIHKGNTLTLRQYPR